MSVTTQVDTGVKDANEDGDSELKEEPRLQDIPAEVLRIRERLGVRVDPKSVYLVQVCLVMGSFVLLSMAVVHIGTAYYDFMTIPRPQLLVPENKAAATNFLKLMKQPLALDYRTQVWQVWVGLHFGQALGMVIMGVVGIWLAMVHLDWVFSSSIFTPLWTLFSLLYTLLAAKFWYPLPAMFLAFATWSFFVGFICTISGTPRAPVDMKAKRAALRERRRQRERRNRGSLVDREKVNRRSRAKRD